MAKGSNKEDNPSHFSIMRQASGPPFSMVLETAKIRGQMLLEVEKLDGAQRGSSVAKLPAVNRPNRKVAARRKRGATPKPKK